MRLSSDGYFLCSDASNRRHRACCFRSTLSMDDAPDRFQCVFALQRAPIAQLLGEAEVLLQQCASQRASVCELSLKTKKQRQQHMQERSEGSASFDLLVRGCEEEEEHLIFF